MMCSREFVREISSRDSFERFVQEIRSRDLFKRFVQKICSRDFLDGIKIAVDP